MKPRNWSRSKTCSLLVGTPMMAVLVATVWIVTRPERKEVVGKMDPASGYRCRFTLSSLWQGEYRSLSELDADTGWKIGSDCYVCTLRPSPVTRWMNSHVLHLASANAPEIRLTTYTRGDLPVFNFLHRFVDGYPEPILESQERMVTHRHLQIDGCPATVVDLEKTGWDGKSYRGTQLLVDVSNHQLVYDLSGFAESSSDDVKAEMQSILSSFHLERVVVPSDAKQRSAQHPT